MQLRQLSRRLMIDALRAYRRISIAIRNLTALAWLRFVRLPQLHMALGKRLAVAAKVPQSLADRKATILQLQKVIAANKKASQAAPESESPPPPSTRVFRCVAFGRACFASLRLLPIQLRLANAYRVLGRESLMTYGKQSVPPELLTAFATALIQQRDLETWLKSFLASTTPRTMASKVMVVSAVGALSLGGFLISWRGIVSQPAGLDGLVGAVSTVHPENLRELVAKAGFDADAPLVWTLQQYVRFANQKVADEYTYGDEHAQIEAEKSGETNRRRLRSKKLRLDSLHFTVPDQDTLETRGLIAVMTLPMRVRGDRPFYEDPANFSGILAEMHPSEAHSTTRLAFLSKDGTLLPCTPAQSDYVLRNGGILYLGETTNTTLVFVLRGNSDALKEMQSNPTDYAVDIEFRDLEWAKPPTWGYFRRDSWIDADWDCQKLFIRHLFGNDKSPAPSYFVIAAAPHNTDGIPEIVRARLTYLRIVDKNGKTVGGYRISRGL